MNDNDEDYGAIRGVLNTLAIVLTVAVLAAIVRQVLK